MRTGAQIVPTFWTRGSGKKLRGKPDAQVLALYLMSGPSSTMIGLYYLPRTTLLYDTGLTEEQFAQALPLVGEIALYDEQETLVYLPEGAKIQIGETLALSDKKRKSILGQLRVYGNHPFVAKWIQRYYVPYNLSNDGIPSPFEAPSKPLRSPFDGASGYPDAPDPRSDPRSDPDPREKSESGVHGPIVTKGEVPLVPDLKTRASLWLRDPLAAGMATSPPQRWAETLELRDLVAKTFGIEPDTLAGADSHGRLDSRVKLLLEHWAAGVPQDRMRQAVRGAGMDDLVRGKPQLQSLQTIFKDPNAVDKYARLAKSKDPAPMSKANVELLSPEALERRRRFREGS